MIIENDGGNDYKILHMGKESMERRGLLPGVLDVTPAANAWLNNRILSKVQKSFWSCTHVNSCQKYTLYINLHILLNILS